MTRYLEISPGSYSYIKVPSNISSGICIDNNVLSGKNSFLKEGDLTFLGKENFNKICIWTFNSDYIFDDSELAKVLTELKE
jgi:hypothetical protein